ncbi:hypothetical protein [Cellulomonas sp. NS3]|uniref:hypothetical protein n=1 Tax=Cellulomonas sp. NS3 TaxID=2973977 RepID=UPI00216331A8|nr:hypothetical protein [Cellulomonas sp. NS3]
MAQRSAVDNDVLIKLSRYLFLTSESFQGLIGPEAAGVLGAAPFVVGARLQKKTPIETRAAALAQFQDFMATAELLEPSSSELAVAAALEDRAQELGLPLDTGESQLIAIVADRRFAHFLTGDKRALGALEVVGPLVLDAALITGVAICFEQIILRLAQEIGVDACRQGVCTDRAADLAVALAFACNQDVVTLDDVATGLTSYIEHLRKSCPVVLMR